MSSPANDSDFAWLRTSPAAISGHPPRNYVDLLRSDDSWRQLYKEWLVGSSSGTNNISRVDGPADDVMHWFASSVADPDRTTGMDERDVAPAVKNPKFEVSYGVFVAEVEAIRQAAEQRAKLIRKAAKDRGDKVPSTKEAMAQAGKETQRVTLANAAAAQGKIIDVNVGLIVQVQIEKFKATTMETFNASLIQISDTPWDEEEGGGGDKAEAVALLSAAGSAVIVASGNLKLAADLIKKTPADQNVDPELSAQLFDRMIEFSDAIAKLGQAMTRAGHFVAKWAQRATKNMVKENFQTIYPGLAGAMLGLRVAVSISQAALDFFPPFNTIGTALGLADAALELAVRELVAWHASQDKETQVKFAGKEFVLDRENLSRAATVAVGIKEFNDATFGKLEEYTVGLAATGVKAVAVPVAKAVAGGAGAGQSAQASAGRLAGGVVDFATNQRENIATVATGGAGVAMPLSADSLLTTVIKQTAGNVPGLGVAMAVKTTVVDISGFVADQNKVMQTRAGLTDEDVAALQTLIKDGAQNPYASAFASGELVLEERQVGPDGPYVYARVEGIRVRVVLGPNPRVDNADEATIFRNVKGLAMQQAKETIQHAGHYFHLDWASAVLAVQAHPTYTLKANAVAGVGGRDYPVALDLAYDMQAQLLTVVTVDPELPKDALAAKLERTQGPQGFERYSDEHQGEYIITVEDLMGFAERQVEFGGIVHTLTGNPTGGAMDEKSGVATFTMDATRPDGSVHRLSLSYHLNGGLEVDGSELLLDADKASIARMLKEQDAVADARKKLKEPAESAKKSGGISIGKLFANLRG
jgi:hypothetical protein